MSDDYAGQMLVLEQFPLNRSLNNFRYHGNPIFEKGATGEWDGAQIRDPMVFYDNTAPPEERWKLYYCGASDDSEGQMQIGLAYGHSLEKLTRYRGNPIVTMTEPWESQKAAPTAAAENVSPINHTPYVFRIPGSHGYEMLYTGRGRTPDGKCYFSTVRVTSSDAKTWTHKKRVFRKFELNDRTYSPTKPIPFYNAEERRYYLIFSASLMDDVCAKNEGFVGLATSDDGESYSFEQVIVPQDKAFSIFDSHGLVTMLGWYFLLITHDDAQAFDMEGNEGYPERWMVSRDLRTWYGSPRSIWDTYPDDGVLYSHLSPLLTGGGMAYMVYDYGEPNVFGLAKVPTIGRPYSAIIEEPLIRPGKTTRLADCYPAISLDAGQPLALTVECTYDRSATSGVRVHIYTSYEGKDWDTEERQDRAGNPVFGNVAFAPGKQLRETKDISLGGRFMKVTAENTDLKCPVTDLRAVVTF